MILSFDLSFETGSFSILKENKVLYMESYLEKNHISIFPKKLKKAFEDIKKTFKDIKKVIVCTGPGSFTGIKIALAFAKGLKEASNIDAVGVSTLRAYAYPYFLFTPTLVLLKAPKNGVYAACFYNSLTLLKEGFYFLEDIKNFLEKNKGLTLIGNSPFITDLSQEFNIENIDYLEKPLSLNAYYVADRFPLPLKANYLKDADVNLKGLEKIKKEFGISLE